MFRNGHVLPIVHQYKHLPETQMDTYSSRCMEIVHVLQSYDSRFNLRSREIFSAFLYTCRYRWWSILCWIV